MTVLTAPPAPWLAGQIQKSAASFCSRSRPGPGDRVFRHQGRAAGHARPRLSAPRASLAEAVVDYSVRPEPAQEFWTSLEPCKMVENKRVFLEEHRIRGNEAGPSQHVTIAAVANILQEAAGNHAVAMWGRSSQGFATDPELVERGLIFVMTRMQIQMHRYPRWGDLVQVETWFQAAGKLGAQREWLLRDKLTGEVLGAATSTWVMINMRTRRPCRMPELVRWKSACFAREPPRLALPSDVTRAKLPAVADPAPLRGNRQVARRADMDMNGHVNNVAYLAWTLEAVPEEVWAGSHLYQVEIDFKAECHAGDVVCSLAQQVPPQEALTHNGAGREPACYVHSLLRGETELVRARTTWRVSDAARGGVAAHGSAAAASNGSAAATSNGSAPHANGNGAH
ncbi:FAT1 [Auxenochlorella protothecoides x Auxenochlorella symbiontica]